MAAAQAIASAGEIEETILQSYLFLGYPTALQALGVWRDLSGIQSVWRPTGSRLNGASAVASALSYAGQYERLRENITNLHPDVESDDRRLR
jgi:4-carboxymuconolactone decarboxylase